jgi:hypothetical protein
VGRLKALIRVVQQSPQSPGLTVDLDEMMFLVKGRQQNHLLAVQQTHLRAQLQAQETQRQVQMQPPILGLTHQSPSYLAHPWLPTDFEGFSTLMDGGHEIQTTKKASGRVRSSQRRTVEQRELVNPPPEQLGQNRAHVTRSR